MNDIKGSLQKCIDNTAKYLNDHLVVARRLNKPLVIEEFGFPRDHHEYSLKDSTSCRDRYYASVFRQIQQSAQNNDALAGCNFWAWGGFGRPQGEHVFWQKGDDYLGDPAQEEQGLNSVFDTDATISLIKNYTDRLKGKTALVDDKAIPEVKLLYARLKNLMKKGIMHVATSTINRLLDYVLNTPADGYRSAASVQAIKGLIAKNKAFM